MSIKSRFDAGDEPDASSGRNAHPLFWLVVLIALLTLVWSLYNHRASEATPAMVQPATTAAPTSPAVRIVERPTLRSGRDARPQHR